MNYGTLMLASFPVSRENEATFMYGYFNHFEPPVYGIFNYYSSIPLVIMALLCMPYLITTLVLH